ncbi:hypothetical protein A6A04_03280 [Paramagnetospirillum marisnigri]|uniref:DUF1150 domain-containing protein n=1 Tax=Paramagnetospirillum marisnigri TaxID=1285242 RepID=A0A178MK82_9PROT|nr:DUF1150 family protein [Paramagnetospirillum marisnigri]OAN49152.1 hypothetical protein A6A04_03280 [Paramagnetospirillum marisnigri]
MKNADDKTITTASAAPHGVMSPVDLANWGLPLVAYVRHVGDEGVGGWAICAADGTRIGGAPDRATAFAAVRQHDLEPLSVH